MFTIRGWNVHLKKLFKDSRQRRSSVVLWKCAALTWDRHPVGSKSPEMLRLILMFLEAAGLIKASLQLAAG